MSSTTTQMTSVEDGWLDVECGVEPLDVLGPKGGGKKRKTSRILRFEGLGVGVLFPEGAVFVVVDVGDGIAVGLDGREGTVVSH